MHQMTSDCFSDSVAETMETDGSSKQMLTNSHERNGIIMLSQTSVSSPTHSRKLEKTVEALSLVSVRALFALVLWYLFSFGAIFLNKYVVDMLNAELITFCKYICVCAFVFANIYTKSFKCITSDCVL